MEWLKEIKKEELPENYREMFDIIMQSMPGYLNEVSAMAILIGLATHYNKQGFYFSGIDAVISRKKREYVIRNRGKKKVSELARITGFSERMIYDIFEELQRSRQRDMFADEST